MEYPNIIIKIVEVGSDSIKFKCIHEGSDYNIDDMPSYNFSLVDFADVDSIPALLQRIAVSAFAIADVQRAQETFKESPVAKLDLTKVLDREIVISLQEAYASDNFQVTTSVN